jgi:hypothetical protein
MAAIVVTAAEVAINQGTRTRSYIAAETITAGQAVYKLAAGTVGVADANAAGKQQYRGIAINGGAAGTPIMVAYFGPVEGFTLTGDVDTLVYLSDTAGGLDTAAGTMTVPVGRVDMRDDGTKFLFTDVNWLAQWA